MSQILAFKLHGGDEVVAEVTSTQMGAAEKVVSYTVRRPHILKMQPTGPNQVGLAFIPWTLSNPVIDSLVIPESAIILTFEPSDHVEKQYLSQTSGIELAR